MCMRLARDRRMVLKNTKRGVRKNLNLRNSRRSSSSSSCTDNNDDGTDATGFSFAEHEDKLAILVDNDTQSLQQLRAIHDAMLGRHHQRNPHPSSVNIRFLFALVRVRHVAWQTRNNTHRRYEATDDDHVVETVANFLAQGLGFRPRPFLDETRSMCLAFLVTRSNHHHRGDGDKNDCKESIVDLQDMVNFLAGHLGEVPHGLDAECPVWWELRAYVSNETRRICHHATTVASAIATGATHVEFGLHTGANFVCTGVQKTGHWVQSNTRAAPATMAKHRGEVVRLAYTDSARRVARTARDMTRDCMESLLTVSGQGLAKAKARFVQDAALPPWAEAAGQVGVAGIGAFVVVGETVVQVTSQVVIVFADTFADLVQHRYGVWAGKSVRDCTETAGSLWLTAGSGLTLISPHAWTRVVARHSCKEHLRQHQNRHLGETIPNGETEAIFDQALKRFI